MAPDEMEPEVLDHCLFQIATLRAQCQSVDVDLSAIQVGQQQIKLLAGHLYRLCEGSMNNYEALTVAPNATTALYEAAIRRGTCKLQGIPIQPVPMTNWLQVVV